MARIFLSYARDDVDAARQLAGCVSDAGHDVWWDRHLHGGSRFATEIEQALKDAEAVVVLWSPQSLASAWVQDEAAEGRDSGRLVPVSLGSAKPPLGFRQFQTIDLGAWDGTGPPDAIDDVLEAIGRTCGTQARAGGDAKANKATESKKRDSVCVLPFINMSGEAEQEYFSDGITEDIITDLSKVSALSVVARNTAFTFKGQTVDVKEVAKALGVTYVLEGSVRKAGNRVRITAQMIDGAAGDHVWADRFDRDLDDIFEIQDEISKEIVRALKIKLLPEEAEAIEKRGTENAHAYNLYLMARQQWIWGSWGNSRRDEIIVRICQQAVTLDPAYAEAWALMALAQAELLYWHGKDADPLPAAERALELNPRLAEPHCVKVRYLEQKGEHEEADEELAKALALDSNSWEVNREAARLMFGRNRMQESGGYYKKSGELMDTDFHSYLMLQTCYVGMENNAGAQDAARRALERAELALAKDPTNGAALAAGACSLILIGETERGKEWTERALLLDPDNVSIRYNVACSLAVGADFDGALNLLGQYFERVESAAFLRHAEIDPDMDSIREDPRFKNMIAAARKRIGVAEAAVSA